MSLNSDSALRRLPQLRYNVQSYKNFVLRYKAYFSKDDDLYDVIEGKFWINNGPPGHEGEMKLQKVPNATINELSTSPHPDAKEEGF